MFVIEEGTEAFGWLQKAMTNPDTHKISVAYDGNDKILLKRNEGMWTHSLSVAKIGG